MVRIEFSLRQLNLFLRCVKNEKKIKYRLEEKILIIEKDLKNQLELIINNIEEYYQRFGIKYNKEPTKLGLELIDLKAMFIDHK